MHPYQEFVNPHLGKMLSQINMDKSFVKGQGCYLYDSEGNCYLDFIAAYGALPFGFNPPEIWKALTDIRDSGEPSFIQPSALNAAGELARKLVEIAPEGIKYVTFTNSGAEAVEAAFKLCRAATGRLGILSTENSFHGKTLGALSATGRKSYQKAFGAPVEGFDFIPYGDIDALEKKFAEKGEKYAAFIIEPIQGEGGIVVPPSGYISEAKKLCEKFGVLLILDEIQSGLGRTGKMFACEEEGVLPDVILLAKALGGGLMPIGACLCTEEAYSEEFAMKHSSTFAANSLAARAGLAALELLLRDDKALIKDVERKGKILKQELQALQKKYPEAVKSIRGRGLMLGIEFGINRDTFPNSLLGIMAEQELLTPIISSYLLNVEYLRVAPTLNGNSVIRIEPPLIIDDSHCMQAIESIDRMLAVLSQGNTAQLLSHLLDKKDKKVVSFSYNKKKEKEKVLPSEDPEEGRFAFLVHPINMRNYSEFDESLSVFNEDEIGRLAERWNDMVEPFVVSGTRIVSKSGKIAYGEFISVPRTADEMVNMPKEQILEELKAAIKLAKERGARIVGLGAYTSVVSRGGQWLTDEGIPITTGNSYTVVAAVEAVDKALARLGIPINKSTAAVVGATGAIGRATSILLSEKISELILIGNPKHPAPSKRRLQKVAAEVCRHISGLIKSGNIPKDNTIGSKLLLSGRLPDPERPLEEFIEFVKGFKGKTPIVITTEIDKGLLLADVVVTATSSVNKLITPQKLKRGAVVCDLSRPGNVSREVKKARPDVLVFDGGVIEVPGRPSLGWNFGFEEGLSYACMAETMMLALEHHYEHTSIGSDLNLETIMYLRDLAKKHGFKLAKLQSFNLPITDEEWKRICRARNDVIEENKLIRTI